jgi:hypothetical protein
MCEDRQHKREANECQQGADHEGRGDDQSPKSHRERARQHRSDRCVNRHSDAHIAVEERTKIPRFLPSNPTSRMSGYQMPAKPLRYLAGQCFNRDALMGKVTPSGVAASS